MVFADFASKPAATVSSGLTSKSVVMVSTSLASKLEDLKIQGFLRHEKILKGIKEPGWKKSKPKAKVAKIRLSGFGYQSI
jgi:hypothetical protein